MWVCKWRPQSACFLLRDHTLYGSLPSSFFSCPRTAWRVSAPCSVVATRINGTNSRGCTAAEQVSFPNKSFKRKTKQNRQRRCQNLEMKTSRVRGELIEQSRDEAESATSAWRGQEVCCGVVSPLCLSFWWGASFACLLFLSVRFFECQPFKGQPTSSWNQALSPFHHGA